MDVTTSILHGMQYKNNYYAKKIDKKFKNKHKNLKYTNNYYMDNLARCATKLNRRRKRKKKHKLKANINLHINNKSNIILKQQSVSNSNTKSKKLNLSQPRLDEDEADNLTTKKYTSIVGRIKQRRYSNEHQLSPFTHFEKVYAKLNFVINDSFPKCNICETELTIFETKYIYPGAGSSVAGNYNSPIFVHPKCMICGVNLPFRKHPHSHTFGQYSECKLCDINKHKYVFQCLECTGWDDKAETAIGRQFICFDCNGNNIGEQIVKCIINIRSCNKHFIKPFTRIFDIEHKLFSRSLGCGGIANKYDDILCCLQLCINKMNKENRNNEWDKTDMIWNLNQAKYKELIKNPILIKNVLKYDYFDNKDLILHDVVIKEIIEFIGYDKIMSLEMDGMIICRCDTNWMKNPIIYNCDDIWFWKDWLAGFLVDVEQWYSKHITIK